MFHVEDRRHGIFQVFTVADPRKDGYLGTDLEEGVDLDYNKQTVHGWPYDGSAPPEACLGRSRQNPKQYKVFKYGRDLQAAGFDSVPGMPVDFGSWSDYVKLNPRPEDLQKVDEAEWFERLDEYDEAARRRRKIAPKQETPSRDNRDEVAAWVAKNHLIVDTSIREVWYLPRGAPPDEIRLLELNDRLAAPDSKPEAIDFGLDVEGARFRLFVADITSEELEQIKRDPSRLPSGWSLDGNAMWRRGA